MSSRSCVWVGMRVATSGRPEARYVKILKGVFWPFARGEARTSATAKKTGSSEGGRCPEKIAALAHAARPGLSLHARDVGRAAAHQQQLDVRARGRGRRAEARLPGRARSSPSRG